MPKITFIGAGSTVFARNLLGDILGFPELAGADDLPVRHRRRAAAHIGARGARALSTRWARTREIRGDDRPPPALDGADYAINMIQVGGYKPCTVTDFEIPKQFGLRQTIADTLGIGGIMRGLRTIPVLLDMCRDMEELCPDVLVPQLHEPDGDQLPGR